MGNPQNSGSKPGKLVLFNPPVRVIHTRTGFFLSVMKKYLPIVLSLLLVSACSQFEDIPTEEREITVSFAIKEAAQQQIVSRSIGNIDESSISDINIYLFRNGSSISYHTYSANPIVNQAVVAGEYTLVAIANFGADIGPVSLAELQNMTVSNNIAPGDKLLMSVSKKITITSGSTQIPVEVFRNVAKIDFSLKVAAGVDVRLESVQFINLPLKAPLLEPSGLSSETSADFSAGTLVDISTTNSYTDVFYMLENRQGRRPEITDQRDKSLLNAPKCATYAHVQGHSGATKVEYYIFLGETNTDDFNVRRNTSHRYEVTINGINSIDTRVELTAIDIVDDNLYFTAGLPFKGSIQTSASNLNKPLYAVFDVVQGDVSKMTLIVNGSPSSIASLIELPRGKVVDYSMNYNPTITQAYRYLTYTVSVKDENGILAMKNKTLECTNLMTIEVVAGTLPSSATSGTKLSFSFKVVGTAEQTFTVTYTEGANPGPGLYVDAVWPDYGMSPIEGFQVTEPFTVKGGDEHRLTYWLPRNGNFTTTFSITVTNGFTSKILNYSVYVTGR